MKKTKNSKLLNNVKVSDADIKKYAKRLTVFGKKKVIAAIVAGVALVGGAAGTAGYFINKSNAGEYQQGSIYINPDKQSEASVSFYKDSEGLHGTVSPTPTINRQITSVKITIGGTVLTLGTDYYQVEAKSVDDYCFIIKNEALNKYSGVIFVTPNFADEEKAAVMFNTDGGSSIDLKLVSKGEKLEKPTNPTRYDDKFIGWYTDEALTNEFDFNTPVTGNMTLYAKWHIPEIIDDYVIYEDEGDGLSVRFNDSVYSSTVKYPTRFSIPEKHLDSYGVLKDVKYLYDPSGDSSLPFGPLPSPFLSTSNSNSTVLSSSGNGAFQACYYITEIELPETITYIPESAFYWCSALKKVYFNGQISKIGDYAFYCCTSLERIFIPDDCLSIGEDAFCWCVGLTNVKLPKSLLDIDEYAFEGCTSLNTVNFNENVRNVGKGAFYDCYALNDINIPISLAYLGEYAFYNTNITLTANDIEDQFSDWEAYGESGTISDPEILAEYMNNGYELSKVAYPATNCPGISVQYSGKEGEEGPYYCNICYDWDYEGTVPAEVTVESSLTVEGKSVSLIPKKITNYGFAKVNNVDPNISKLVLPKTIESIGEGAFENNTTIISISFSDEGDEENSLFSIGNKAFIGSSLIRFNSSESGEINLPDSLVNLGYGSFYGLDDLERANRVVHIPASTVEIQTGGLFTYENSDGETLTVNKFPFADTSFYFDVDEKNPYYLADDYGGFYTKIVTNEETKEGRPDELVYLTNPDDNGSYEILAGTKQIYDLAFTNYNCGSITTLKICDSLETFNSSLAYGRYNWFYYLENFVTSGNGNFVAESFEQNGNNDILYRVEDDEENGKVKKELVAFLANDESNTFKVGNTIETIGPGAFMWSGKTQINLDEATSLNTIEEYAFYGTRIAEYNIPASVINIGDYAFDYSYTNLRDFTLNSLILINSNSSEMINIGVVNSALKGVYIPEGYVEYISNTSFIKTLGLTSGTSSKEGYAYYMFEQE